MRLDPHAIPSFKKALKLSPDAVFNYIDVLFKGFRTERWRDLYADWERVFVENDDAAVLEQFYVKYGSRATPVCEGDR